MFLHNISTTYFPALLPASPPGACLVCPGTGCPRSLNTAASLPLSSWDPFQRVASVCARMCVCASHPYLLRLISVLVSQAENSIFPGCPGCHVKLGL